MAFDLKKSVQEYTDLTIFRTPKSDISEREGNAVGILRDVLTQSPEVQQAFNQAVCQQTDRVFHGWDYWLGGQNVKAVRSAILYNSPADCSNSQQNRQLTVDLLNPQFSKISFAGQYVSSPELEEFKNLYVTGEFKLADDLSYVLDALPDFRTNGAKARVVLTSLIPAKWLAYIGLFGGAFSFGFGTAKVSQAIQELNHIQDEKQRKVALRDLARGSSTMLLSLVSMLGASKNFDWSAGKNVTRLPTAASKAPEQPNRGVLPEDKIAPIRSKPSPTLLNQKPANDNFLPTAADENGYCVGNPSGPSGSPWFGSKGGQSFSNPPVQSLRSVAAAGGSGRGSISSAASQKAEEMCEGAKYSFNGNAALAIKPNPVQSTPIPPSTAPGQCGNGAALPANSPLIFSDYNGEHVSHASLINLKGVEEYLAHLITSFPTVLAVMMSADAGSGNPINEKIEDKQAIDEVNPMVEIVEGFFTSYLESLEEELWAKLVSRTIEEEIAFQRESVPWRKIPPEIVAFAQRHPTARMWRLEVRPGGLEDESLNAEQIFFRNLLNYFHTQLNLSTDWSNWIGTSVYDLDNRIDSSNLLQMLIPGLGKKNPSPFRQMIIPPILFLLEVPTIFFADRAVRGVRTKKLSSESEMEAMADNNTRPLLTSNSSENLSDHANIFASSALKWFHDLSHIIELSRNLPETREDFRKIRYAVKAVLKQLSINLKPYSKLDVLLTSLFEGTDLQLIENPHLVFQLIAESLSVPESFIPNLPDNFIPTLYQQLQIFFPEGHPRREEVLDRFRRAFAYTPVDTNYRDFVSHFSPDKFPGFYLHEDGTIVYRAFGGRLDQLGDLNYKGIEDPRYNRLTPPRRIEYLRALYESEGPYSIAKRQRYGGRRSGLADRVSLSASVKVSDTQRYGEHDLFDEIDPKLNLLEVTTFSKDDPLLHVTRLYRDHLNLPYGEAYGDGEVGVISPIRSNEVKYYWVVRVPITEEIIYYEVLNPVELKRSLLKLRDDNAHEAKDIFFDGHSLIAALSKTLEEKGVLRAEPRFTIAGKIDFFAKKLEGSRENLIYRPSLKSTENLTSTDSSLEYNLIKIKDYLLSLKPSDLENTHVLQALRLLADECRRLLSNIDNVSLPKTRNLGREILSQIDTYTQMSFQNKPVDRCE